jgi:ATP-dependent helicase IRC3
LNLRPYQINALNAIYNRKVDRGIIALPTGCGKSVVAAELHQVLNTNQILYLAHREELIDQLAEHMERVHGWGMVGVEQANRKCDTASPIVVASVPTLTACDCKRLKRLGTDRFDAIVVDEAHHGTADSYRQIWRYHGILNEDDSKPPISRIPLIGLTATPGRGDGVGLNRVFDEIIYQMKLAQAIKDGWLVPVHAWTIKTDTDLSQVRTRMGEYVESELAAAVSTTQRNSLILDAHTKQAHGLKTLIFCVNVEHSVKLADYFNANDIPAKYVAGTVRKDERENILKWFAETPGAVLTNCQIVTEGVDIPSVECVIMARPTKSATLYAQCLGRGTRLAKGAYDYAESVKLGKDRCILLDIADTAEVGKRAVNVCDLFGSPFPDRPVKGENVLDVVEQQEMEIQDEENAKATAIAESMDLFSGALDIPGTRFSWFGSNQSIRLNLGRHGVVTASSDVLDRWTASYWDKDTKSVTMLEFSGNDQQEFIAKVEDWIENHEKYRDCLGLINKESRWRTDKPSKKQTDLCQKLGIFLPDNATKGMVSIALDRYFEKKNKRRVM